MSTIQLAMSVAKNEFIVGGKYRLLRKIGSGSFGDIYLGINISNGEVRSTVSRETICQHIFPLVFLNFFLFFHCLYNELFISFLSWINFSYYVTTKLLTKYVFYDSVIGYVKYLLFFLEGLASCKFFYFSKVIYTRPIYLGYFQKFYEYICLTANSSNFLQCD